MVRTPYFMAFILLLLAKCSPLASEADDNNADEAASPYRVAFDVALSAAKNGSFVIEVHPDWSPIGAARFKELEWSERTIMDDPVLPDVGNREGFVTFAKTPAANSRSTQLFINFADNTFLDSQGFTPFAKVVEGMDVVNEVNAEYGEEPSQGAIRTQGTEYLLENFPRLSYIISTRFEVPTSSPTKPSTSANGATPSDIINTSYLGGLIHNKLVSSSSKSQVGKARKGAESSKEKEATVWTYGVIAVVAGAVLAVAGLINRRARARARLAEMQMRYIEMESIFSNDQEWQDQSSSVIIPDPNAADDNKYPAYTPIV